MSISRKLFKYAILVLVSLPVGLVVWGFLIEPNRLVLNHQTIVLSSETDKQSLRIAAIGDLHTGAPFMDRGKLEEVVALANAQQPDLIVLLGDYMVEEKFYQRRVDPEITAGILKKLRARLGVLAVLGNHDYWYNGERVKRAFQSEGIRVLENDAAEIRDGDDIFWVAGLADAWTNRYDLNRTLKQIPAGASIVLLTHNPDVLPVIPNHVKLVLAAHTHGGQVNLPFFGRRVVPSEFGQRYAAGTIRENGKTMFVTTGIGTSILPVRFRVPPEIAVLTVQGL